MKLGGRAAKVAATIFVGGLGGAAAWWGCTVYDTSLLLPAADAAGDDGSAPDSAGDDGGPDAPGACAVSKAPARPATSDPSDAEVAVVVAMRTFDLGLRDDGGPAPALGYDLDNTNTCCADAGDTCKSAVHANVHCDEDGGRDNSGGELIRSFASVSNGTISQDTIQERLDAGVYSLLFAVTHYNGQPNDNSVIVAVYDSPGIAPAPDGGAQPTRWDGTDVWAVNSDFAVGSVDGGPPIPVHFDTNAYVAGGTIVSQVSLPIRLGGASSSLQLTLTGDIFTAQLVPDNGTFRMDEGRISGRIKTSEMLDAVRSIANPYGKGYICPSTGTYNAFKVLVCQGADIMSDPMLDNTGATCDAVSFSVGFTADPAVAGPIVMVPPKTGECGEAGPDDCF